MLVIHDDLDLAVGVKAGGSSGGHNGVSSVEAALSSKDFWRLRIGIGRPPSSAQVADYVLERFRESEADTLAPVLKRICDYFTLLLGPDGTISQQTAETGMYSRGVSTFLNALSAPRRAGAVGRRRAAPSAAAAPSTSAAAAAPPPSSRLRPPRRSRRHNPSHSRSRSPSQCR